MASSESKKTGAKAPGKSTKKKSGPTGITESQLITRIADTTGLTKVQTKSVFGSLSDVIATELRAKRPVKIPGLAKITLTHKDATPERRGINPFTKEPAVFKAKPARDVVKVRPLKALKEMA